MADLKDLLNNRLVTPNVQTSGAIRGFGVVTRADEKNNCCDIRYVDAKNRTRNKKNVPVKATSDGQWFPFEGSKVEILIYEDRVDIVGEFMNDYVTQGKQKSVTKNDIYMDDDDSTVGGYIM